LWNPAAARDQSKGTTLKRHRRPKEAEALLLNVCVMIQKWGFGDSSVSRAQRNIR